MTEDEGYKDEEAKVTDTQALRSHQGFEWGPFYRQHQRDNHSGRDNPNDLVGIK